MKLPDAFLTQMREILKDEYDAYLASFDQPRHFGLRVNEAKISVADFLKISPFELKPVEWCHSGFYYDGLKDKPAKHPYYHAGLYYLQEPSAMAPAEILDIEDGDVILDGCAAPGGKSTQLYGRMGTNSLLVANDISASRAQGLLKNLEMAGCINMLVTASELEKLDMMFDKILIDAPCSGQGMFRKEPQLIGAYQKRDGSYYSPIQKKLLKTAAGMLKPGGRLVYSTCTFDPRENEEVIQDALDSDSELCLLPIKGYEGFADGLNGLTGCKRLYPHRIQGEGHFLALLQRKGNSPKPASETATSTCDDPFFRHLDPAFLRGHLEVRDERILMVPTLRTGKSVRVLRSGLLLGRMKNNGFEPSQALAMALRKEQFDQVLDLNSSDERVIRYLKGETIDCRQYDLEGWVLICVDGYPLGFARISSGIFKNRYDRNWRYV